MKLRNILLILSIAYEASCNLGNEAFPGERDQCMYLVGSRFINMTALSVKDYYSFPGKNRTLLISFCHNLDLKNINEAKDICPLD